MQSEHATRRCPCCGGASRTLGLSDVARRHHQCLSCGHRHAGNAIVTPIPADHPDRFACLLALPLRDRDVVEGLILLMLGTGTLLGTVELVATGMAELQGDHGPPSAVLRGFAFPVFSWLVDQEGRQASHFVAIDQGQARVCFRVRRRRPGGPL